MGVGVLVRRNGKILLGRRVGSHGAGTWAAPGGHLEYGEQLDTCARREVFEETGLSIENVQVGAIGNDVFAHGGPHYVTIFMVCDCADGEPQILEPDKCEEWRWFGWDELPCPLFLPLENVQRTPFSPFAS